MKKSGKYKKSMGPIFVLGFLLIPMNLVFANGVKEKIKQLEQLAKEEAEKIKAEEEVIRKRKVKAKLPPLPSLPSLPQPLPQRSLVLRFPPLPQVPQARPLPQLPQVTQPPQLPQLPTTPLDIPLCTRPDWVVAIPRVEEFQKETREVMQTLVGPRRDPAMTQRGHLTNEFFETEKIYNGNLNHLLSFFDNNEKRMFFESSFPEFNIMLDLLKTIKKSSDVLLTKLQSVNDQVKSSIGRNGDGDALQSLQFPPDYYNAYFGFIGFYGEFLRKMGEKTTEKGSEKMAQIFKSFKEATGQGFDPLMINPVQRGPRHELLLRDLLKATPENHPAHQNLSSQMTMVQRSLESINRSKAVLEENFLRPLKDHGPLLNNLHESQLKELLALASPQIMETAKKFIELTAHQKVNRKWMGIFKGLSEEGKILFIKTMAINDDKTQDHLAKISKKLKGKEWETVILKDMKGFSDMEKNLVNEKVQPFFSRTFKGKTVPPAQQISETRKSYLEIMANADSKERKRFQGYYSGISDLEKDLFLEGYRMMDNKQRKNYIDKFKIHP